MSKQHLSTRHSLCHHSNHMADMVKTTSGTVVGTMTIIMAADPGAIGGF